MPTLHKLNVSMPPYRARLPLDVASKLNGRMVVIDFPAEGPYPARSTTIRLGTHAKVALRTADRHVALHRRALIDAKLQAVYSAARHGPQPLSQKNRDALAGRIYKLFVEVYGENPGDPSYWSCLKALNRAVREGRIADAPTLDPDHSDDVEVAREWFGIDLTLGINSRPASKLPHDKALEARFGMLATLALRDWPDEISADDRKLLLLAVERCATWAAEHLKKCAENDWTPDPRAASFPSIEKPKTVQGTARLTLTGCLDRWWAEAKALGRSEVTRQNYDGVIKGLVAFLEHDDAARVTVDDLNRYKTMRLTTPNPRTGKTTSAKTVKDTDLVAMKSVFGWAVANRLLPDNPAKEVKLKAAKVQRVRDKSLSDAEAKACLKAATAYRATAMENPKSAAAKRWIPWLMAYTGCRISEATQLRKEDIIQVDGFWAARITPEAGSVKTGQFRVVVLHQHLIEQGFVDFVSMARAGHLFVTPNKEGSVKGSLNGVTNRLTDFAREVITDPNVSPNHGWRHRFIRLCRIAEIPRDVRMTITGHAFDDEGDEYGEVPPAVQATALAKYPREG